MREPHGIGKPYIRCVTGECKCPPIRTEQELEDLMAGIEQPKHPWDLRPFAMYMYMSGASEEELPRCKDPDGIDLDAFYSQWMAWYDRMPEDMKAMSKEERRTEYREDRRTEYREDRLKMEALQKGRPQGTVICSLCEKAIPQAEYRLHVINCEG